MYQVSNSFLQAMDDISRTLAVEVEISGETYPTESIIDFELERGAFDGDVFTIGQTLSSALTLTIFTTSTIKPGDEVKLFVDLLVGESYRRVPMGIYYVDSTSINQEKMRLTCYDKMVSLVEEYIPSGNHKTLSALFNDVKHQIGMTSDGVFTDVAIDCSLYGYTYRETLGFIASLNGGNMVVNRAGHLEIQRFQKVERSIPAKACFSFEVKEPYRVSKVFCQFGDVGITRGDSSGQCVAFENPYVTEQNIDTIYNLLNGLSFTAASLNYRGDLTLDPGDIFQFTDYKGDIYPLMCGRNKLTFNGGLSGQLDSIGESETTNSYAESQLKYKKNITKLTAELGKIQGVVQEIEQSHDGLEQRVSTAESKITDNAITNTVKKNFYTKEETENVITSKEYATQSQVQQTAESITNTVSQTYYTKSEIEDKKYTTSSELKQTVDEFEFKFHNQNSPNLVLNGSFEKDEIYTKSAPFVLDSIYGGSYGYPVSIDGGKFLRLYTDGGDSYFEKGCAIPVTPQQIYTVSYYYCSTTTAQGSNCLWINGNLIKLNIEYVGDRGWHRAVHKIILGSNVSGIDTIRLGVVATEACWVLFDNLQVELGDQVTDFKPHKTEFNTGITFIDSEGVGVKHSDGTYTKMTSSGFVRKIGSSDHLYHYLSYVGKVQKLDMSPLKIQLPSEFKNKTFRVILSLEEIANPAGYMVQSIHLVVDNYDYANATFEILYGTMSQFHDGTNGMMQPTTIGYTVIA